MLDRYGSRGLFLIALSAVALVLGLLCRSVAVAQDTLTNPYTGNPEAIAEGQRLYREARCYPCHGFKGEGATGPDLTDDVWRYRPTDGTLFRAISHGRRGTLMPGWKDKLTPDQIWQLITFIRSIYKGDQEQ